MPSSYQDKLTLQAAGEKLGNEVMAVGTKVLCHASFDTDPSKALFTRLSMAGKAHFESALHGFSDPLSKLISPASLVEIPED